MEVFSRMALSQGKDAIKEAAPIGQGLGRVK